MPSTLRVGYMVERAPQPAVIIIFKRYKAERLQHPVGHLPHRAEDFGHPVHRTRLRLKRDFNEIALCERFGNSQQPAGNGNGLEFGFGAPAVFQTNRSQHRIP